MKNAIKNGCLKRFIILLLSVILALSCFPACDGDKTVDDGTDKTEQSGDSGGNGNGDGGSSSENGNQDDENGNSSGNEDDGGSLSGSGLPTVEFPPIPFD